MDKLDDLRMEHSRLLDSQNLSKKRRSRIARIRDEIRIEEKAIKPRRKTGKQRLLSRLLKKARSGDNESILALQKLNIKVTSESSGGHLEMQTKTNIGFIQTDLVVGTPPAQ
jgi:hypothetical protein